MVIVLSMEQPEPVRMYFRLINEGRSPYIDVVKRLLDDLDIYANQVGYAPDSIYTINLKRMQREIEVKEGLKMTSHSIGRTLRAFFWNSGLREGEEYYVSKSGRLAARYHLHLTRRTRAAFSKSRRILRLPQSSFASH